MFALLRDLRRLRLQIDLPAPPRGRSLAIRHVDAGSCNGCEHEAHARHEPALRPAALRPKRRRLAPPRRPAARHRPGHHAHAATRCSPPTTRCPSRAASPRSATARSAAASSAPARDRRPRRGRAPRRPAHPRLPADPQRIAEALLGLLDGFVAPSGARHDRDRLRHRVALRRHDRDPLAEPHDLDAVGELEDVGHVVADQDHRQAALADRGGSGRAPGRSPSRRAPPSARP